MQHLIETALLSGQKTIQIGNVEVHFKQWELKRDTSTRRRKKAEQNAIEILQILQS